MLQGPEIFRFGELELGEERGTLLRAGASVEIRATPLRLLRYLVRRPGRVIPREEIFTEVWRDVVVSDAALATALKQIRRLLGVRRGRRVEGHFVDAASRLAAMGARPLLARVQVEHARTLLARREAGDRERAVALLETALATARSFGMAGLVACAGELMGSAEGVVWLGSRRRA